MNTTAYFLMKTRNVKVFAEKRALRIRPLANFPQVWRLMLRVDSMQRQKDDRSIFPDRRTLMSKNTEKSIEKWKGNVCRMESGLARTPTLLTGWWMRLCPRWNGIFSLDCVLVNSLLEFECLAVALGDVSTGTVYTSKALFTSAVSRNVWHIVSSLNVFISLQPDEQSALETKSPPHKTASRHSLGCLQIYTAVLSRVWVDIWITYFHLFLSILSELCMKVRCWAMVSSDGEQDYSRF